MMKQNHKTAVRRTLSICMALLLAGGSVSPVLAAEERTPSCDETYYATLDYYGALLESSVVKTYRPLGQHTLTDYGSYDSVINLTDSREASLSDGSVTFDFGEEVPEKFYFEGKTALPYEQLPWTLSLSYSLNGVPAAAEELASQTGVVEITLDALPNESASEYSKNNLVLVAASMFNGDDILSLEAPGAQIQLLGNLYCVLYAVLPGEEQHFTIRVGSEDFSYNGMTFLAVPATLGQLEKVADLKEVKEETEDSYHAISDSMDAILDALDGMSGSLNTAADGLDRLNSARGTISGGKGRVYGSLDTALGAGDNLTEALSPTSGHLETMSKALTDIKALLDETDPGGLKPEMERAEQLLIDLQADLAEFEKEFANPTDIHNAKQRTAALRSDLGELEDSLEKLGKALKSTHGITTVPGITVDGMTSSEIRDAKGQADDAHDKFEQLQAATANIDAYLTAGGYDTTTIEGIKQLHALTAEQAAAMGRIEEKAQADAAYAQYDQAKYSATDFKTFLTTAGGKSDAEAEKIIELQGKTDAELEEQLGQLDSANNLIGGVNEKVDEINGMIGGLAKPAANTLEELMNLTGTLSELTGSAEDLLKDLDKNGEMNKDILDAASKCSEAASIAEKVSSSAGSAVVHLQEAKEIYNTYEPELQKALADAQTLTDSATVGMQALTSAARSAKELLQASGSDLDEGTKASLSGLSAALRQATNGLDETDSVRTAMDTVKDLISDQWDEHTGGSDNLLLMDANAPAQSLTDSRNAGVKSIQVVMRTKEIKLTEEQKAQANAPETQQTTFWGRIKAMFVDLWNFLTRKGN